MNSGKGEVGLALTHQGRDMKSRTPFAVFVMGLPKKEKKTIAKKAAYAA